MRHKGSCTYYCGHQLDIAHVRANPGVQRQLDRDPRVVEYTMVKADDEVEHFEFVYSPYRQVASIYRVSAEQLKIKDLA